MALCAVSSAVIASSSVTSLAPASTITMPSLVPATTRSSLLCLRCGKVGLTMNWPSTRPTRTAATVFSTGISDSASAAPAPVSASTSESFSVSADSTNAITCVSYAQPDGNSGRIGRSMTRLVRVSFSVALPSRLKKPPGMRPDA